MIRRIVVTCLYKEVMGGSHANKTNRNYSANYKILGPDEFVEVFEIAEPGKDFELYVENHYRRKK